MGFRGRLRDLSLVDIFQVVQLTRKSGVLDIHDGPRRARLIFRDGNIVDAHPPGREKLTGDLLERGLIAPEAEGRLSANGGPPEAVGERLVRLGLIGAEALKEVLVERVEATVQQALSWINGTFDFDIVEPGGPPPVVAIDDVLPGLTFDTQQVLLDALRVFDERRREGPLLQVEEAIARRPTTESPPEREQPVRLFAVGPIEFRQQVSIALKGHGLETEGLESEEELIEGLSGGPPSAVLVILYVQWAGEPLREAISRMRLHARALTVITVGSDPHLAAGAVSAGAYTHVGLLPEDPGPSLAYLQTLVARELGELKARRGRETSPGVEGRLAFEIAALRDRLESISREAGSASVSMRILMFVAERMERGVLFLVRPGDLMGLGAFGSTEDGSPIGPLIRDLKLPLEPGSIFRLAIEGGRTVRNALESSPSLDALFERIGRPRADEALFVPLRTVDQVVALIYADAGYSGAPIPDHSELDVLAYQAGLVLENAFLRRQLERQGPGGR